MSRSVTTIVIPTRNRLPALIETLNGLTGEMAPANGCEVVVVDDGSSQRVAERVADLPARPRVVRREGGGRSLARNAGAAAANGDTIVFLDDDITVRPGFLGAHLAVHREWPRVIAGGAIRLVDETTQTRFGRFRRKLEGASLPGVRGLVPPPFAPSAGNMSLPKQVFLELDGFDPTLAEGEDQDLVFRYRKRGGTVAFVPDALGFHRDNADDLTGYLRRVEMGAEYLVELCRRHPDWAANQERVHINGPIRVGRERAWVSVSKCAKLVLGYRGLSPVTLGLVRALEAAVPTSRGLDPVYRALIGVYLFRGFRRGLSNVVSAR